MQTSVVSVINSQLTQVCPSLQTWKKRTPYFQDIPQFYPEKMDCTSPAIHIKYLE